MQMSFRLEVGSFSSPELETHVLWISRSILFLDLKINLILILYPGKCLKFNQPMCRSQKPNSQSEAGKLCTRSMRELWLVGTQQGYPKERIKQKIKVPAVDIEMKWTGLRASNTRVSSSVLYIVYIPNRS